MVVGLVGRDVPAAEAALRGLGVAFGAVERAAVEELLDPRLVVPRDALHRRGHGLFPPALGTRLGGVRLEHLAVVFPDPAGDDPGPGAERAGHPELGQDGPADELALVREL